MKGSKPTQDSLVGGLKICHLASGSATREGTKVPQQLAARGSTPVNVASCGSPGIRMGRGGAASPHRGSLPLYLGSYEQDCAFGTFLFGPGVLRELQSLTRELWRGVTSPCCSGTISEWQGHVWGRFPLEPRPWRYLQQKECLVIRKIKSRFQLNSQGSL